mmetsp:Transcript_8709/g.12853  ORF Transcript_8709/g.12853 Transcript_8709/m.12853 type:complete len:846 (+) Transcript_8709:57-2594(+)
MYTFQQQQCSIWYVEKLARTNTKVMVRLLPIHRACELNAPEPLIQALLTAFLDGAKLKDYGNGFLPIHFACIGSASSFGIINIVLGAYEEGVMVKDALGRLPLHLACENGASKEVIEILLAANPESIEVKDKDGQFPIHCACQNLASEEVIQMLLRAYPNSTNIKDYKGNLAITYMSQSNHPNKVAIMTTLKRDAAYWMEMQSRSVQSNETVESVTKTELYKLIENQEWSFALDRAKRHPGEAKIWFVLRQDGKGWWRQLPIHELCKLNPPTAVMDALLDAYVEGAQIVDHYGILPIHLACWGASSAGVVRSLIDAYPTGVRTKDKKGMLPLHSACWGGASEEVINILIKAYPQSIEVVDDYGRTPLKIIQERDTGSDNGYGNGDVTDQEHPVVIKEVVIAALSVGRRKTELYQQIEKGNWEAVLSRLNSNPAEAMVQYIVKDSYGGVLSCRLPLHLSCQVNAPVQVVEALLNCYTPAAFSKGNGDSLPIHYACAYGASEAVVESLLRAHPLSIYEKDTEGRVPRDYVTARNHNHIGKNKDKSDTDRAVLHLLERDPSHWKADTPKLFPSSAVLTNSMSALSDALQSTNQTELYRLIENKDWNNAILRCGDCPKEAAIWRVLKDAEGRVCWRELPLHRACHLKPPTELIEALLNAYPDGLQAKDKFGMLPLHVACEYGASEDVIHYLVQEYPLSTHEPDIYGRTPWKILQSQDHDHPNKDSILAKMSKESQQWFADKAQGEGDDADYTDADGQSTEFSMGGMKNQVYEDFLEDESGYADWQSVINMSVDKERMMESQGDASHFSRDDSFLSWTRSEDTDSYAPRAMQEKRPRCKRNSSYGSKTSK